MCEVLGGPSLPGGYTAVTSVLCLMPHTCARILHALLLRRVRLPFHGHLIDPIIIAPPIAGLVWSGLDCWIWHRDTHTELLLLRRKTPCV
jgi:hypothetical protein